MRRVHHFSCGAASAVAIKLSLSKHGHQHSVIYNAYIAEEHPDNRRFAGDCERWFQHPITVLRSDKYGSSVHEVWRRERFMRGPLGASCSLRLKRETIDAVVLPGDTHIFGFTAEESERAKRFLDTGAECPLIEHNLTKADCLAIVERAGIELPMIYRMGYNNANCRGCCKGGKGYWNRIRIDFPEHFAATAAIQRELGPGSYFWVDDATGERIPLDELNPAAGRHDEVLPSCSFFCAMAEEELE